MEVRRRVSKVHTLSHHAAASSTFWTLCSFNYVLFFSWSLEPVHAQPRHHVCLLGEHVTGFFWLIFSSQITTMYQQMELILGPSSHLL
jgi:hypothetical protein